MKGWTTNGNISTYTHRIAVYIKVFHLQIQSAFALRQWNNASTKAVAGGGGGRVV